MPARTDPPRGRRKADQFTRRRNRLRTGTAGGFRPAIVRAHRRAFALSVTPGNSRRSSTAADSSPPRSKAARIVVAASTSETTNIAEAWERGPQSASAEWERRCGRPIASRNGNCWKLSSAYDVVVDASHRGNLWVVTAPWEREP